MEADGIHLARRGVKLDSIRAGQVASEPLRNAGRELRELTAGFAGRQPHQLAVLLSYRRVVAAARQQPDIGPISFNFDFAERAVVFCVGGIVAEHILGTEFLGNDVESFLQ